MLYEDPALIYKVDVTDDEDWAPPLVSTRTARKSLIDHRNKPSSHFASPSRIGKLREKEEQNLMVEKAVTSMI